MRKLARADAETIVGALAMVVLAVALWIASAQGKASEEAGGYRVTARFDQIDGLAIGNPVYMAGIHVGSVVKIELAPGTLKPLVTFSLKRGIAVPADSAALVMSDGVLGGKFVRIEPGSESEPMKAGDRFQMVQDSVIVEQILEKIVLGAEGRLGKDRNKPGAPDKSPPEKK
ncbi:MAG: MCE family protein [Rhodospirillaceae bacterium]|nr:MCE family protein [Rhodospirillaceae bacterium]